MNARNQRSRRALVVGSLALPSALALAGLGGCQNPAAIDRQLSFASLAAAQQELDRLAQATGLSSAATWTWAQTLDHCAQSIEYSMSGFPEPKSPLFQRTLGTAALQVFAWRGRMSHDLADPIPGAPPLAPDAQPGAARARLQAALANFRQWTQPLRPHFAYGELDKKQYELAHAMHLANHFSQFQANAVA